MSLIKLILEPIFITQLVLNFHRLISATNWDVVSRKNGQNPIINLKLYCLLFCHDLNGYPVIMTRSLSNLSHFSPFEVLIILLRNMLLICLLNLLLNCFLKKKENLVDHHLLHSFLISLNFH